jgi:hypothetical protein
MLPISACCGLETTYLLCRDFLNTLYKVYSTFIYTAYKRRLCAIMPSSFCLEFGVKFVRTCLFHIFGHNATTFIVIFPEQFLQMDYSRFLSSLNYFILKPKQFPTAETCLLVSGKFWILKSISLFFFRPTQHTHTHTVFYS